MNPWEHYIRQYVLEHPGKLVVAPARKKGKPQPYTGPSRRTKARRAARKNRGKQ